MIHFKLTNKEIRKQFQELWSSNTIYTPQKRGYEFEKLISAKLFNEGLEPRTSYKAKGEQIDGSFFWEGQTFLLEAKWTKSKLSASSIYAFKGKLDGKFHTTSGIYLSIGGYHDDVEDALKFGKELNILLFDDNDIRIIFENEVTFIEVLKFKLRQAGDTGSLNIPYQLKKKVTEISKLGTNHYYFSAILVDPPKIETTDIFVFVEGKNDIFVAQSIMELLKLSDLAFSFKIIALNGADKIRQLPSLYNLYSNTNQPIAAIVLLEESNKSPEFLSVINSVVEQINNSLYSVETKFYFIPEQTESKADSRILPNIILPESFVKRLLENISSFLSQKLDEYYYDPEYDLPKESLKWQMNVAEYDFENNEIVFPSDIDHHPIVIKNVEELANHLNEEIVREMNGRMPLNWLKSKDYLDYDTEAREYLFENHKKEIKKLGWDINQL